MNRRPKTGETLRIRNGGMVTVGGSGIRWVRVSKIGQATSFLVQIRDLVEVQPEEQAEPVKAKATVRPAMNDLDAEFLGDLE